MVDLELPQCCFQQESCFEIQQRRFYPIILAIMIIKNQRVVMHVTCGQQLETYRVDEVLLQKIIDALATERNEEGLISKNEVEFGADGRIDFVDLSVGGAELAADHFQILRRLHSVVSIRCGAPLRRRTHPHPPPPHTP